MCVRVFMHARTHKIDQCDYEALHNAAVLFYILALKISLRAFQCALASSENGMYVSVLAVKELQGRSIVS